MSFMTNIRNLNSNDFRTCCRLSMKFNHFFPFRTFCNMATSQFNPWIVTNLEEFLYFCCPECDERSQSEELFLDHAFEKHPNSKECLIPFICQERIDDNTKYEVKEEIESTEEQSEIKDLQAPDFDFNNVDVKPDVSTIVKQESDYEWNPEESMEFDEPVTEKPKLKKRPKQKLPKAASTKLPQEKTCKDCNAIFPNKEKLKEHKLANHKRTLVCDLCGKGFAYYNSLKIHKLYVHNPEKNFQCDQFEKKYKCMSALIGHKKMQHENVRYPCNQCSMSFKTNQCLTTHKRKVHLGEDMNIHQCNECGKKFHSSGYLSTHIKAVHKKEMSFECQECNSKFAYKSALMSHMRGVHENRRDFVCELCAKAFLSSTYLKHHLAAVHKGVRKFQCKSCDKSYAHLFGLKRHVDTVHEGKRFDCDSCQKSFTQEYHLKQHIETSHGIS